MIGAGTRGLGPRLFGEVLEALMCVCVHVMSECESERLCMLRASVRVRLCVCVYVCMRVYVCVPVR